MIVKELDGNLVKSFLSCAVQGLNGMAHGCNCHHAMASGIAGEVAREIPEAVIADDATPYGDKKKLGKFSKAEVEIGGVFPETRTIYNLYTQFYPGKDARYPAVFEAFTALNKELRGKEKRYTIGVPLIGSGIGGLEWESVKQIINYTTPDVDIVVYHFKP